MSCKYGYIIGACIAFSTLPGCTSFFSKPRTVTEKTLAIIKPDAVRAKYSGKIIDSTEHHGFTILKLEKMQLTSGQAEKFYAVHKDKPFFNDLIEFMTSGPIIIMVLDKENAIADWRTLMGSTNPIQAAPDTLRRLFGTSINENAVHGSDSQESAKKEIALFSPTFKL